MRIVYGYLISYVYIIVLLVVITVGMRFSKAERNDAFRKTVHIMVGFTWIPLCEFLYGTWHFTIVPLSFVLVTALSVKFNLLKVVERDTPVGRKDFGIVHYAISMTLICLLATLYPVYLIPCGIGVFALSFGDGFAAVFGQAFRGINRNITKTKTVIGAIACFVFTIIGMLILARFTPFSFTVIPLLLIGVVATVMEVIGGRFDNYTVPVGTIATAILIRI